MADTAASTYVLVGGEETYKNKLNQSPMAMRKLENLIPSLRGDLEQMDAAFQFSIPNETISNMFFYRRVETDGSITRILLCSTVSGKVFAFTGAEITATQLFPALGGPLALVTDNFNRANANPIGAPWLLFASSTFQDMQIESNQATRTTFNPCAVRYDPGVQAAPDDQYAQVLLVNITGAASFVQLFVRQDGTANGNAYYARLFQAASANSGIYKLVNGVATQLLSLPAFVPANGDTLKLSVTGPTLTFYRNGVLIGTVVDATIASGQFGFGAGVTVVLTSATVDNFEGGASTGAPVAGLKFPPLKATPTFLQANNNLCYFTDGERWYVTNGTVVTTGGMPHPVDPPTFVTAAGALNVSTNRFYWVSWADIGSGLSPEFIQIGNSSPSSDGTGPLVNKQVTVTRPDPAPPRASHWMLFASQTDGESVFGGLLAVIPVATTTFLDTSPFSDQVGSLINPFITRPIRNGLMVPGNFAQLHKGRIFVCGFNKVPYVIRNPGFEASTAPTPPPTPAGPTIVGTGASVSYGDTPWTAPGNITAEDAVLSTCDMPLAGSSDGLQGTTLGFAVPSSGVIQGILLEVKKKRVSGSSVADLSVKLLKAGVVVGTDRAHVNDAWSSSLAWVSYGNASDLWGTTWTPADINNANFGAQLVAFNLGASSVNAGVDAMRITVYYTVPGSGAGGINGWLQSPGAQEVFTADAGIVFDGAGSFKFVRSAGATGIQGSLHQNLGGVGQGQGVFKPGRYYRIEVATNLGSIVGAGSLQLRLNSAVSGVLASATILSNADTVGTWNRDRVLVFSMANVPSDLQLQIVSNTTNNSDAITGYVDFVRVWELVPPALVAYSALEEVEGLHNGRGEESFPGSEPTPFDIDASDVVNLLSYPQEASELVAMAPYSDALVVFANLTAVPLYGSSFDDFGFTEQVPLGIGCASHFGAIRSRNGLYFVSGDFRVYETDIQAPAEEISLPIRDQIASEINGAQDVFIEEHHFGRRSWIGLTYTKRTGGRILRFRDHETGMWFKRTDMTNPRAIVSYEPVAAKRVLLVSDGGTINVVDDQFSAYPVSAGTIPAATIRQALFDMDDPSSFKTWKEVSIHTSGQPTGTFWIDPADPDATSGGTAIGNLSATSGPNFAALTQIPGNEFQRAWLSQAAGAYGKRLLLEIVLPGGGAPGTFSRVYGLEIVAEPSTRHAQ